eukprot:8364258-Pyramimonas_sp.AAC.1
MSVLANTATPPSVPPAVVWIAGHQTPRQPASQAPPCTSGSFSAHAWCSCAMTTSLVQSTRYLVKVPNELAFTV